MFTADLTSVTLLNDLWNARQRSETRPPKSYNIKDIRRIAGALVLAELIKVGAVQSANSSNTHDSDFIVIGRTGDSFLDSILEQYYELIEFEDISTFGEEALKYYGNKTIDEEAIIRFRKTFRNRSPRTYGEHALISILTGSREDWEGCTVLENLLDDEQVRVEPWSFGYTVWGQTVEDANSISAIKHLRNLIAVSLS